MESEGREGGWVERAVLAYKQIGCDIDGFGVLLGHREGGQRAHGEQQIERNRRIRHVALPVLAECLDHARVLTGSGGEGEGRRGTGEGERGRSR